MTCDQAHNILKTAVTDSSFTVGALIEKVENDQALQSVFEDSGYISHLDAIATLIIYDIKYKDDYTNKSSKADYIKYIRKFKEDYVKAHFKPNSSSGINAFGRNGFKAMLDSDIKDSEKKAFWGKWRAESSYPHTIDFPITEITSVKDLIQEAVNFSYYCHVGPRSNFLAYCKDKFNIVPPTSPSANGANPALEEQDVAQTIISDAIEASIESGKKCVIFTGAPGTGKTYCVERYMQAKMEGFERGEYFVQFHSSYDYTDFVEGLRPIRGENGKMDFVRMDGIFKAFCRRVVELNRKSGSPESGAAGEAPSQGREEASGENMYYFVIDEINRADLGQVFGELMYCFEKRGEKIATQYENLPAYSKKGELIQDDCFKAGFYIPENVVIIGTMNDIDRSVETFDFALRRRFDWVEIDVNTVMSSSLKGMKNRGEIEGEITPELVKRIKLMNEKIAAESGLSSAFAIGPAYFKGYNGTEEKLREIWQRNIQPILREYMRGRQGEKAFISQCERALFPGKEPEADSQPAEPQGGADAADAQQGEQE